MHTTFTVMWMKSVLHVFGSSAVDCVGAPIGSNQRLYEFTPVLSGVRVVWSLVFCVMFCRSLCVLLSFFFQPLYCLSFEFSHICNAYYFYCDVDEIRITRVRLECGRLCWSPNRVKPKTIKVVFFASPLSTQHYLYSACSLKQQSADRYVPPLWHITLIPSRQPVFALSP
jgi:hypothetical protein